MKDLTVVAVVAAGLASVVEAARSPEAFRLADADVVVNRATAKTKRGADWYKCAISDLTNKMAQASGRVPVVYDEGSEPGDAKALVYLGETAAAKSAGISGEGLRNGDWRLRTDPGRAYLFGKTGMAASYAMTEFVESCLGTGFYVPDDYQPREADPDFRVPCVDITRKPVIYVREVYMAIDGRKNPATIGSWRAWERRNRGAATDELESSFRLTGLIRHEHTIFSYIPPDKYFKDHPEYYSMGPDGKRRGIPNDRSQICYTNPDAKEIVYRKLLEMIETDRRNSPDSHPAIYDMTQMDNSDFLCLCPECRKVIAKYNRVPGGHSEGGDAGLQLEFVNDIARRVAEKYPDVVIRVFAYVSGEVAPRPGTIKPEPNVLVWWCDLYGRSDHTLPLLEPSHFNNEQAEHLREWFRLTPNVEVWDYKLGGFDVCHEAAVADAKFFSDNGSPIIFMESEYGGNNPFYYLNCYAMLSAYANPDQDADALLRRFCRGAYGKAADEMYAATSFLQEIERSERSPTPADWSWRRHPWRSRNNYERLAGLLQKAYDREDDARVRSRVVDALQSTWGALVSIYKAVPSAAKEYAFAQEAYRRYGKEYAANGFVEPSSRAGLAVAVDDAIDVLTLRFDDLPEELRGVDQRDLICADYHFFNTWDRGKLDAKAYRGHAVKSSPNDDSVKGFPVICGVYDRISKENRTFRIAAEALPADGKFHWVKLGRMHNGRDSIFWFPGSWRVWETLRDHYIVADGQKVDPNWYEMWVSMAVDGPAFVPGSAEPNAVKLDRYVLRRVSP